MKTHDVIIIGAGFFGLRVALFFAKKKYKILILEAENTAFKRASLINQARVHNGYHYPKSYPTALSSHNHYQQFCEEYNEAIDFNFQKIYGIAKNNSNINSKQFEFFCKQVDIPLKDVPIKINSLFSNDLIENTYLVDEVAFDGLKLRDTLLTELLGYNNIEIKFNEKVHKIEINDSIANLHVKKNIYKATRVFNAAYAGINNLLKNSGIQKLDFKLELAEIVLIKPPKEIEKLGVTIMDGQYWSTMPYPAFDCHSLSHVRYTPHMKWHEKNYCTDAYKISDRKQKTKQLHMLNDAKRYLPIMKNSDYIGSKYTIKTVVSRNEINDGRPIVVKEHSVNPLIVSILGSKIDNIYDLENYLKKYQRVEYE